jgi:mono/diheme cytochrome c family protein
MEPIALPAISPKFHSCLFAVLWSVFPWVGPSVVAADPVTVDYNRDIRPILADNCYKCHGPDGNQRQAGLRLDRETVVGLRLESGHTAITAGSSTKSAVVDRILSRDLDERMPPRGSGKSLTAAQIDLLKRWIDQGAAWQGHWAFQAPSRPSPPLTRRPGWHENPIDAFVLGRLHARGLTPSPEASRETLIRRVTLDLTGLPPSLAEIDRFLTDSRPAAYQRLVDRLLASPRFGEHAGRIWLDAARYGDTHGLHLDNERSIWPYRDWVVAAFNANMPFDQFTVEQLAGDLLPKPSVSQLVATGFNRCNVTTSEGGAIADEYRFKYGVDRVETTSTVWLGLTMGCAVCHEHKFDPIPQQDFYRFLAYFNSLTERAMDGNALLPPPSVKVPTPIQSVDIDQQRLRIAAARQRIDALLSEIQYKDPGPAKREPSPKPREVIWIDDTTPPAAQQKHSGSGGAWKWVTAPSHPPHSGKRSTLRTASGLGQHFFEGANPGLQVAAGDSLFAWVRIDPANPPQEIMLQFHNGNWEHRAFWGEDRIAWGRVKTPSRLRRGDLPRAGEWVRLEVQASAVNLKPGDVIRGWAFTQFGGTVQWDTAGMVTTAGQGPRLFASLAAWTAHIKSRGKGLPKPVLDAARTPDRERSQEQKAALRNHFLVHACRQTAGQFASSVATIRDGETRIAEITKTFASSLIMRDLPKPRTTYVLKRGQYDIPDKTRPVQPGVPSALPPLPKGAAANRLGMAQWLVTSDHPLTARVTVNRFWQQFFGTGLVKTSEDFGAQGEWPSHPRLLDWLATEFVRTDWNIKLLQKLIVTSSAYRQSSRFHPEGYRVDPENRMLWRGPRYRLDAEVLRDAALAVGGQLVEQPGGKGVKPYQPSGLWRAVGYSGSNTVQFVQDHGSNLFRRSLYTFWKRTAAPPTMLTFDAPSREACSVRRARTNTPLQALLLLNDVQFVECARGLAERLLSEPGTDGQRLTRGFRMVTSRFPTARETAILTQSLVAHRGEYRANPKAAKAMLAVGEAPRRPSIDPAEHAAWTVVANLLLNLDEAITKN